MPPSLPALARAGLLATSLALALCPPSAEAGNTEHPRTPVLWPESPCIATLVRADDPEFAFAYTIPFEDTLLSFDEFEDSRTHQFLGFCRQWPAGHPPPRYVSVADLERSVAAGFEQATALAEPESTLETSAAWAGCWTRITTDDGRRAITYAAAEEPVVWDTAGLEPGTWVVAGYTWEPPYNLWSRAPWALRIVDEDPQVDPTPLAAAAVVADTDDGLYFDASVDVEVCVDAELGSTVTLEWTAAKDPTWVWSPVAELALTRAGEQLVSLPFAPPEPSWGATVLLRARVEQPIGPADVGHAPGSVVVFKPADPGAGEDTGEDTGDGEAEAEGTGDGETETGSSSDAGSDTETSAGRCSVTGSRGTLPACWFALALVGLRIRRARPHGDLSCNVRGCPPPSCS
jgi:hypothetical protein